MWGAKSLLLTTLALFNIYSTSDSPQATAEGIITASHRLAIAKGIGLCYIGNGAASGGLRMAYSARTFVAVVHVQGFFSRSIIACLDKGSPHAQY